MTRETRTILIASASTDLCEQLAVQLDADGYRPYTAFNASSVRVLLSHGPCALLLGDLEHPGDVGGLLRQLRADELDCPASLPVITFGADDVVTQLRAYELGSDHHMRADTTYVLLRAMLASVLRRSTMPSTGATTVRVGSLTIDHNSRRVSIDGEPIDLSAKEYGLLRILASDPTRVFTKDQLLMEVWGHRDYGSTRTLDSHACRLRRRLGAMDKPLVQNIWGVGYRLTDVD